MIEVGVIEKKQDASGHTSYIELNEILDGQLPKLRGSIKIFIEGNNQELINKLETQIKSTVTKYGAPRKK